MWYLVAIEVVLLGKLGKNEVFYSFEIRQLLCNILASL
jgi:hypothetical protein